MHDENRYNWNIFDIRTRWTDGVGTDLNQIRLKTDCQKEEHLEDRERQKETTKDRDEWRKFRSQWLTAERQ